MSDLVTRTTSTGEILRRLTEQGFPVQVDRRVVDRYVEQVAVAYTSSYQNVSDLRDAVEELVGAEEFVTTRADYERGIVYIDWPLVRPKTFLEYERLAARTMNTGHQTWREQLANAGLGVAGEAGEISDIIKKLLFHQLGINGVMDLPQSFYDHLIEEIGDQLFYLAWTAKLIGVDLAYCAQHNNAKLARRWPDGFVPAQPERDE